MILSTHGIIGSSVTVASGDADALAFFTAAGITDTTQKSAINTLVTDLKTANIWTKMKALYPFVGGTAASHRFNLKDPRTVDAAFYLDFLGGGTHSANGYQPNGTNAYADTKLTPSTSLLQDSTHVSYYSRTNNLVGNVDFGAINSGFSAILNAEIKGTDGTTFFRINRSAAQGGSSVSMASSSVFYMINRKTSSEEELFVNNNSKILFSNKNSTSRPSFNIYLGAVNLAGVAMYNANKESAFVSIGDGLTDGEASAFYTAVQAYNTTLNRQV